MEQHTAAISQYLTPLLLAVIAYLLMRYLGKNERDHDELFSRTNEHSRRLSVVENEVEHLNRQGRG